MHSLSTLLVATIVGAATAAALPSASTRCSPVSFKVAAAAENVLFQDVPDQNNSTAIMEYMNAGLANPATIINLTNVSGTYDIHGTYCRPSADLDRNTLQIFVHGASYNQSFWTGLGFGETYDWVAFANADGYHTLALDGLTHGLKGRPLDPFAVVQISLEAEILHQLITSFRTATSRLARSFDKFVLVGHSLGSAVGSFLATRYPLDVDAYVLTGWSISFNPAAFIGVFSPAAQVYPQRFSQFPLGYLTTNNATVRESAFYGGAYDPAIPQVDFAHTDAFTAGEFLSSGVVFAAWPSAYAGRVMVVTGDLDGPLCGQVPVGCADSLQDTLDVWSNATETTYYIPPNTGHNLNLHYSAPETFSVVQKWLDESFTA